MSILTEIGSRFRNFLLEPLLDENYNQRIKYTRVRRQYRMGAQKNQLVVKPGHADDNLILNFIGLAVDRSISMLFGNGIDFDLPGDGDDTPEQVFIDDMWEKNRKSIFLHKSALYACENGTGYIKIIPDWYDPEKSNKLLPKLVNIDPSWVEIVTAPEDQDEVISYVIQFNIKDEAGRDVARKQEHNRIDTETSTYWEIVDYKASSETNGRWVEINRQQWPYVFPAIVHWQNLPSTDGVYGEPDITQDSMLLQDKINFVASNINKIIRYHAHPKTWGRGVGQMQKQSWGPDEMVVYSDPNATVQNLEMQSDLTSSEAFLQVLRQSFMDITRTVDITNIQDKVGALTNFGLRVLYQDALAKLGTKRELYGEALKEVNARCLEIVGMKNDPGEIIWPDPLPENGTETTKAMESDLNMGIVSKQTIATLRGYDWEQEQDRKSQEEADEGDVGTKIIENFMKGQ